MYYNDLTVAGMLSFAMRMGRSRRERMGRGERRGRGVGGGR